MKRVGYLHEKVYAEDNIELADDKARRNKSIRCGIKQHDKNYLRNVLVSIKLYLKQVLNLELKPNYQIFPVESRGIDFVGYKFYHTHVLLRKSIKMRMFRLINLYK